MARYDGPIADGDIHHHWQSDADVLAYLPEFWRDYAGSSSGAATLGYLSSRMLPRRSVVGGNIPHGSARRDSYPAQGRPGSSYELLREQVLDRYDYFRGVLTYNVGANVYVENPYFGVALSRAMHDWNADHWLDGRDDRLFSVVIPSTAIPEEGAAEIRRVGASERIVATLLTGNALGRPFGDPLYHPLYEATAEMGLGLDIHPGIGAYDTFAAGPHTSGITHLAAFSHAAMHHITSLIVNGVFEKYPTLRVHLKEHGTAWLPHLIWKLDEQYDLLRIESPWVRRWPSEYIHDHIRIGTQPLEESDDPQVYRRLISAVDGVEDMLVFTSDYPHTSSDSPTYVAGRLPAGWQRKVMCDNVCEHYGWEPPPAGAKRSRLEPAVAGDG